MIYVPGSLFSVNPVTARGVPNLFARNERVVCVFESPRHGPFVAVLVGATIVGSIATVWHGVVNPKRTGKIAEWAYAEQPVTLRKQQGGRVGRTCHSVIHGDFAKIDRMFGVGVRHEGVCRIQQPRMQAHQLDLPVELLEPDRKRSWVISV